MSVTTTFPDMPPPWYRQLWPWLLIAIPATSVLLGILMIVLATSGHDALVVDDWYKEGKGINRRIERDAEAARLGLVARVASSVDALVVELASGTDAFEPPPALGVRWVHVTRADRDGDTVLAHVGEGRYVAPETTLPVDGRWRLHLEPLVASAARPDAAADPSLEGEGEWSGEGRGEWRLVSEAIALAPGSEPLLRATATPASAAIAVEPGRAR